MPEIPNPPDQQAGHNHPSSDSQVTRGRRSSLRWIATTFLILLAGAIGYWYVESNHRSKNGKDDAKGKSAKAVPVYTATASLSEFPIYLNSLGTVTAYNSVTIRSRVDGIINKIAFQEGQAVKKDELLIELDPRPFAALLAEAQGNLTRDQAMLAKAKQDVERSQQLLRKGSINLQDLEAQESMVQQLEGTIAADQSRVNNAKLQLEFASIKSPISGRIGLRKVDVGNFVRSSEPAGLAVVTQLQPISVTFTVPQDDLFRVRDQQELQALAVEAYSQDFETKIAVGNLRAIDNQVDVASGTVKVKAEFPNEDNRLFPNQFVNIRMLIETRSNVVTIPAAALQHGPNFDFTYVVTSDNKAELRKVTPGPMDRDVLLIEKGLAVGDVVVIQGFDKLQPGMTVEPQGKRGPPSQLSGSPKTNASTKPTSSSTADAPSNGRVAQHAP